jgi:predicted DsbA family dithiol-disulfide isomerase
MKVEIWSDIVCPWCYIGKRRFEAALAGFDRRDEVEVVWRSFELDPEAPPRRELSSTEHLAKKYGMPLAQAVTSQQRITTIASAEGLEYDLGASKGGNSFDAHRLLHLAAATGFQGELKERLLRAYFSEGEAIGEPDVLERIAVETGLDAAEVTDLLTGDRFAAEVRDDEQRARALGINGVPFFVIDERYGISGAQPAELIGSALEQAWSELHEAAAGTGRNAA